MNNTDKTLDLTNEGKVDGETVILNDGVATKKGETVIINKTEESKKDK